MNEEPIAIVIDTNNNEGAKNSAFLGDFRLGNYDDYIAFIEKNDLVEKVHIFIPEVVLKESIKHCNEELKSCVDTIRRQLERIKGIFSGVIENFDVSNDDRKKYIEQIEKRIKNNSRIIPIPEITKSFFDSILNRAIYKKAPFRKGESDPGFKDAVIWESLKSYFNKNQGYSEVLFFTNDGGFCEKEEEVRREFFEHTGKNLFVIKDDLISFISNRFRIHLDFINYLNTVFYPKLIEDKTGGIVSFNGYVWNIDSIIAGSPPIIKDLGDDEAEIYASCLIEAFQLNNPRQIDIRAEMTLRVKFEKDENAEWCYKDEIVGFRILR